MVFCCGYFGSLINQVVSRFTHRKIWQRVYAGRRDSMLFVFCELKSDLRSKLNQWA